MLNNFFQFARDEEGTTAIEYSLIASLIFVVIIGSIHAFGQSTSNKWSVVASAVDEGNST